MAQAEVIKCPITFFLHIFARQNFLTVRKHVGYHKKHSGSIAELCSLYFLITFMCHGQNFEPIFRSSPKISRQKSKFRLFHLKMILKSNISILICVATVETHHDDNFEFKNDISCFSSQIKVFWHEWAHPLCPIFGQR